MTDNSILLLSILVDSHKYFHVDGVEKTMFRFFPSGYLCQSNVQNLTLTCPLRSWAPILLSIVISLLEGHTAMDRDCCFPVEKEHAMAPLNSILFCLYFHVMAIKECFCFLIFKKWVMCPQSQIGDCFYFM